MLLNFLMVVRGVVIKESEELYVFLLFSVVLPVTEQRIAHEEGPLEPPLIVRLSSAAVRKGEFSSRLPST